MSFSTLIRHPLFNTSVVLGAIATSTWAQRNYFLVKEDQADARMDELEGTLRGHIGLIEDALDRIEGKTPPEGRV